MRCLRDLRNAKSVEKDALVGVLRNMPWRVEEMPWRVEEMPRRVE